MQASLNLKRYILWQIDILYYIYLSQYIDIYIEYTLLYSIFYKKNWINKFVYTSYKKSIFVAPHHIKKEGLGE